VTAISAETEIFNRLVESFRTRTARIGVIGLGYAKYDAVLVSTAHSQFKNPALDASVKLAIDTRNIVPPIAGIRLLRA